MNRQEFRLEIGTAYNRTVAPVRFDKPKTTWKPSAVQITLTKDLEKFVVEKAKAGGYVDPSEVVREALREFRAKDDPAEVDSQELAELLLPAVRGPHRVLTDKHFDTLRRRARCKPARGEPSPSPIRLLWVDLARKKHPS